MCCVRLYGMQERRPEEMGLSCWEQKGNDGHAVPVGTLNRRGPGGGGGNTEEMVEPGIGGGHW